LTILSLVLTVIKILQELRMWKRSDEEKTALQKILKRMTKRDQPYSDSQ
jgi:hypothetical protein